MVLDPLRSIPHPLFSVAGQIFLSLEAFIKLELPLGLLLSAQTAISSRKREMNFAALGIQFSSLL